jgi:hypothetical protein
MRHVYGSSETFEGACNMMYCFTLSQVFFLRDFLVAVNCSTYTAGGSCINTTAVTVKNNSTDETATTNNTQNCTNEAASVEECVSKIQVKALMYAVGLLVTELVSVLLIAWSLSILYRLACL